MSQSTVLPSSSYVAMALDALSFAKTSSAAGNPFNATSPVSVDAWIRFSGLAANTVAIGQDGVFSFGNQGPLVYFQFNGLPQILSDPAQPTLQDDHWHYICLTFDGSMLRLYIDGQFNTGQSCMGSVAPSSNPVNIGQNLQGLVKRVRIYNTTISAEAVLNYMYGAPDPSLLTADFDFSVNPPVDRGPSAYPIALQNSAFMSRVSPAVSMGTTGFVRPMGDKDINPGGAQIDPYAVQAWIYVTSSLNPTQAIFVNSDLMLDTGIALYLQYDSTISAFRLVSQRGSGGDSGQMLTSSGKISVGTWTNVATTFDGATLSLYINGAPDSSKSCPPIPLYRQQSDLLIGAAINQGVPTGSTTLQGFIREVDVWSRALSAAEIATYTNASPDVSAPGIAAAYVFTNSPARNQVNGHPIGLAEGAVLAGQLEAAPLSTAPEIDCDVAAMPEPGLDAETLAAIRKSLDFKQLLSENAAAFDAAMSSDIAAFTDPKDKALLEAAWKEARRKLLKAPTSMPFLTTRHVIGSERMIIVHRPHGSYVAYRAAADATDDCTLWKINLVFIVVAGALDAFTGVGARLGDAAIAYIGRILANPAIAAQLARGNGMNAITIFAILSLIYTFGLLRPLIVLLLDVGFWTLIRVVANLILVAAGVGAARVVASLVATAATFVVAYLAKPSSCNPLPIVDLASLAFDYDPTGEAVDALTIRRNFSVSISSPEWTKGTTGAAAARCAYAISAIAGKTPTIQATFTISAATTQTVEIQATGGGILGAIDPTAINFSGGGPVTQTLSLTHQTLAGGGVQRQDVSWVWQYRVAGGSWTTITTTNHRVYVLMCVPRLPWQQGANRLNLQLPWTDVLDYACQWAAGATSQDTAMSLITTKVNQGIGLQYDVVNGASKYTDNVPSQSFLCTQFLAYLSTGGGNGKVVNCTDCATLVTSFANILGCNVFASTMADEMPPKNGFACNQILAIGYTTWKPPFQGNFSYHEVAWTDAGSYTDPLYDACLQYDSGPNPWETSGHTAALPVKAPFTTLGTTPSLPVPTPFTPSSYRERLCANTTAGIGSCRPLGQWIWASSGRRPAK